MSIANAAPLRKTRFVCVSDTHGASPRDGAFKLPKGDVLIHAGDLTNQGSYSELKKTIDWIEEADFEVKIVVAGNHDVTLDSSFYSVHSSNFHNQEPQSSAACISLLTSSGITYLNHASTNIRLASPTGPHTTFRVFGSPYSPVRGLWGFSYPGYKSAADDLWSAIPLDTDVLITHTPPLGHLDLSSKWGQAGCAALQKRLWAVRPALSVFGHVHEGRGAEIIQWGKEFAGREEELVHWNDPGLGTRKLSLVDLTGRRGTEKLDNDFSTSASAGNGRPQAHSSPIVRAGRLIRRGSSKRELAGGGNLVNHMSRMHHDNVAVWQGRQGRKETCVVNAAIMARSHGMGAKRFNHPIVVDINLPIWSESESQGIDESADLDLANNTTVPTSVQEGA
ncbi:Metallo-dependent phosphatase [Myriangium duriaei CBS 260.36]|uniref:Metallo-dependent phosphatase n=1 Tax=Myriangium duriaei CBS 260.36 TaxID=1168546 RepID=A0A9P4J205_9PEZI|nr:Metallo-dependent phosphatase [Myriangium duriaei CBS 260.36]